MDLLEFTQKYIEDGHIKPSEIYGHTTINALVKVVGYLTRLRGHSGASHVVLLVELTKLLMAYHGEPTYIIAKNRYTKALNAINSVLEPTEAQWEEFQEALHESFIAFQESEGRYG